MEQQNYDYLVNSFARLGFDGVFDDLLKTAMQLGKPNIELKAQDSGPDWKMSFAFQLSKKEGGEYYFLNNVKTTLNREGKPTVEHDFLLYNQQGYSIRQMKKMLEGKSVHTQYRRENRDVELWRRIDFTATDERGNNLVRTTYVDKSKFDLTAEINKLPVQMSAADKQSMEMALKNGETVNAVVRQGANRDKVFIEATPHLNKLSLFDEKGEKYNLGSSLRAVKDDETQQLSETTRNLVNAENQQQGQNPRQGQSRRA